MQQPDPIPKVYWSVTDLARHCDVSIVKIAKLYADGIITYTKLSKRRKLFDKDNVDRIAKVIKASNTRMFNHQALKFLYEHNRLPQLSDL